MRLVEASHEIAHHWAAAHAVDMDVGLGRGILDGCRFFADCILGRRLICRLGACGLGVRDVCSRCQCRNGKEPQEYGTQAFGTGRSECPSELGESSHEAEKTFLFLMSMQKQAQEYPSVEL
ncbi:hypothetical protein GMO_28080 [Gluconobacter morbifer G707]|uniref:Uncharacterized protein n=1 Tax=Gluconobacter morbifer G707 TaxID=1088869 RepID=G6XMU0_9PROT|nr:hypothetical protein GMO_28080 [Gluconobacter morbifer G707]